MVFHNLPQRTEPAWSRFRHNEELSEVTDVKSGTEPESGVKCGDIQIDPHVHEQPVWNMYFFLKRTSFQAGRLEPDPIVICL